MNFLVVFDTCTHARYYGDVHEVLALPPGAVIRYEYKRYLYTAETADLIDRLVAKPLPLPVPALLMYGQKRRYRQGEPDPQTMLTVADSVFIPTRSAWLTAVAREKGAKTEEDVLYLHFQMRGFVDPDKPEIAELASALELADALPFGDRAKQYSWIAMLPPALENRSNQLVSDDQENWSAVVSKFVTAPTQFEKDVFWRVREVSEVSGGGAGRVLNLQDRATNQRVHTDRWRRDFCLYETKRYAVAIQTFSPEAHGHLLPADASVAMTSRDDDEGLIRLSAHPLELVPNEIASQRFSVATDNAFDTRFAGIRFETQSGDHAGKYPPGSLCTLTFAIRKQRWRIAAGIGCIVVSTAVGAYAAAAKLNGWWSGALAGAAITLLALGGWFLTRQFKLTK